MQPDSEEALRITTERYRSWLQSIAEVAKAICLLVDSSGTLLEGVSHGVLHQRLGIGQLSVGTPVAQIVPQLGESLLQALAICRHTGHSQKIEHTIDAPDGVLLLRTLIARHQHNSYSIFIKDAHHERTLALRVESLASDQRQTVALLHELDSRNRTLFDALSEGVLFLNREGQVIAANESAALLFRCSVAELCKLTLDGPLPFQVIGEDLQPLPIEQWPAYVTLSSGVPRQGTVIGIVHASGAPTWLEVNSRPLVRAGETKPNAVVLSFFDITVRKQMAAELLHRAFHDPLTALPNRSLFVDRLDTAIRQARRAGDLVAVFFLDLDGFKEINDAYGHAIGDRFLQSVAHRLSNSLRDGDTVARFGGDEFTILLPAIQTAEAALRVAERVLEELQKPMLIEHVSLKAAASLGISLFPHDGQESSTLLRNADQAMYRVKSEGRNGCQFFRSEMHLQLPRRVVREEPRVSGLTAGALRLRYRPLIDLGSEQTVGWAAELYRQLAGIPPEHCPTEMALADEILQQIFQGLLEQGCRELPSLTAGKPPLPLLVRVDGRHLIGNAVQVSVARALERTGLSAPLLELDILSPTSLVDGAALAESLWQLHRLGVRLSLSASPLAALPLLQLSQLPLSAVTLPEALWRRSLDDKRTASFCEGLVSVADRLGYIVAVTGIMTQAERMHLLQLGCLRGQGPLWAATTPPPTTPQG